MRRGQKHTAAAIAKQRAAALARGPQSEETLARRSKSLRAFHGPAPHGTLRRYRRGCSCRRCREANAAHTRGVRARAKAGR
jgi:hypothetical protein